MSYTRPSGWQKRLDGRDVRCLTEIALNGGVTGAGITRIMNLLKQPAGMRIRIVIPPQRLIQNEVDRAVLIPLYLKRHMSNVI